MENPKKKISPVKLVVIGLIAVFIACFFIYDLGRYLQLSYLKEQQETFQNFYAENSALTLAAFFIVYVISTALSLPGAAILTLAGGAMFGLVTGTIVVSFASTLGATLAFLVARFLLRDAVMQKFGDRLEGINRGIEKEGAFYLFTMRLIPAIPFFIINLVMGLTPIRTVQYFFVSQIGMLPGTIVYVNAGTQIAKLDSLKGILSPSLIASFVALGVFPIVAKKAIEFFRKGEKSK